jgi:drug/metabolite transporter (DMT)-like permease
VNGTLLICLSSALFAVMAVMVRSISSEVSPGQLVLIRFLVGLLGVLGISVATRELPRIPRLGPWALRGVLGSTTVSAYFYSIEHIGAGPATLLNYSAPAYAALFGAIFLKERVSLRAVGAMAVATAGAGLVAASTAPPGAPLALSLGAWVGLAGAISSGAAFATMRSLRRDTSATSIFLSFCLFGVLIGCVWAPLDWRPLTLRTVGIAVAMGVVSFAAQIILTHALAFVTVTAGSATTQITPVMSWVLAIVLLGEPVRALTVVGAVLCAGGVVWGAMARASSSPPSLP